MSLNNWFALDTYIHDGRNPTKRKVANNTVAIRRGDDIAIQQHETDVLTFHADRPKVTYNTGGWYTVTTKVRLNTFGPEGWRVTQSAGVWTLQSPGLNGARQVFRFWDGMTLDPVSETIVNESDGPDFDGIDRFNKRTRNLITSYVRGLTDSIITELVDNPTGGDCFYCLASDPFGDVEHLESHLRERYYMTSLVFNAYKSRGYSDPGLVLYMHSRNSPKQVRQILGKYLRSRLLAKVATR